MDKRGWGVSSHFGPVGTRLSVRRRMAYIRLDEDRLRRHNGQIKVGRAEARSSRAVSFQRELSALGTAHRQCIWLQEKKRKTRLDSLERSF